MKRCLTFSIILFSSVAIVCYYYLLKGDDKRTGVPYPKRSIEIPISPPALIIPSKIITNQSQPVSSTVQSSVTVYHNCTVNETIHIAVVVVTDRERTSTLPLLVLIKSILVNRHLPLHLHFLSDSTANNTIHSLLSTWNLPYFKWTIYCTPQTQSIPSIVYGNILLNMLLPPTIEGYIVMSIDSLVIKDLSKLWHHVQRQKTTKVIAMDDFESNILLMKRPNTSSVQGYNSTISPTRLVDMFSELPMIVPCSRVDKLCKSHVISQQLHVGKTLSYVKTHSILKYDGDIVPETVYSQCNEQYLHSKLSKLNVTIENYCNDLNEIANYKYRTLLYFYGRQYVSNVTHDVTLVTQLTFDRLSLLPVFLTHWTGPASIALYVADEQLEELYNFLNSTVIINERARENLAIHIVFNHSLIYPINYIRNVALNNVNTPYVFLNDFEMLPNYGCYELLTKSIKELNMMDKLDDRTALVIPAFETVRQYKIPFPKSKTELIHLWKAGRAIQFHRRVSKAHKPTGYGRWRLATKPYNARYHKEYEPYIVVRSDVVRYNTTFVGYGWNKVSQIMELHAQSYKFLVHPNLFVLHEWHPVSLQRMIFKSNEFQICLGQQMKDFIDYIFANYGQVRL